MKLRYILLAFVGSLILFGCNRSMSEQEYGEANLKIAKDFLAYGRELQDQALPVDSSMTKEQRRAAIARSTRETGDKFEKFLEAQQALKPPKKFESLHRETVTLYKLMADQWHAWAAAMERDDKAAGERIANEMDTVAAEQQAKVIAELGRLFPNHPKYRELVDRDNLAQAQQRGDPVALQTKRVLDKGAYVAHWTYIGYEYCEVSRTLKRGPDPIKNEPPQKFGARLIAQIDECTTKLEVLVKREEAVVPPKEYEAIHQATIKLMKDQVPRWRRFRDAYKIQDRKTGEKAIAELSAFIPKQLKVLRKAGETVQSRATHDEVVATMEKWNPMSAPTDPSPGTATSK